MFSLRTALALAVVVVLAFAASGYAGYRIGKGTGAELVRRMQDAGVKAIAKRDAETVKTLEKYREEIAAVSARPLKRVYFCPPAASLPEAPGGVAGPGPAVVDNHDYGPDLRAARDALLRYNALIGVVR